MNGIRAFVKSILWVEIAAIVGLLLAGLMLTWAEGGGRHCESFFSYRIHHLDGLPAWFAAALALMSVNGFWAFRLSAFEGAFHSPGRLMGGRWGASIPINPLKLFAINLIAVPAAMMVFLVVRANCW